MFPRLATIYLLTAAAAMHLHGTSGMSVADVVILSRASWNASAPTETVRMVTPVPYVVVHHSYVPAACNTSVQCVDAMRQMQKYHQVDRGWFDIGYTFAVGGDGNIYAGRGWNAVGAHAPTYNDKSVGICIIGDWRTELPPEKQLAAVKNLIEYGVRFGHIKRDYILLGHRQTKATECPGGRLFREISEWDHYGPYPDRHETDTVPTG